jgi:Ca2+-binding EF-hand superfamily protein
MLSPREVLEVVKAQFPVDADRFERELPGLWKRWDKDGSGCVDKQEFMSGLLAFVRSNYERSSSQNHSNTVPDIRNDRLGWFRHFDEDASGELSREEVARGLIKCFHLSASGAGGESPGSAAARIAQFRELVQNVWPMFDADGSGSMERDEFLLPEEGLADAIIASYGH